MSIFIYIPEYSSSGILDALEILFGELWHCDRIINQYSTRFGVTTR